MSQLALNLDFARPLPPVTADASPICSACRHELRAGIDEGAKNFGRTLCLDCFELEMKIEPFTAREALEQGDFIHWNHVYF